MCVCVCALRCLSTSTLLLQGAALSFTTTEGVKRSLIVSLFHPEEADFRRGPGQRISMRRRLGLSIHCMRVPTYHRLPADWSREDKLQLEDDCQSWMVGQPEVQVAPKAQHLRRG